MSDEMKTWPALAQALGFTRKTITGWRKMDGAPKGRDLAEWEAFIEEQGLGSGGNKLAPSTAELRDEKLRKDIRLKELQIAEKERKSVLMSEVDALFFTIGTKQKSHLYAVLCGELPTQLAGQDAAAIRVQLQSVADEVCDVMRTNFEQWKSS